MSTAEFIRTIESGDWKQPTLAASTVPDTTVGRRGDLDPVYGYVTQPRRRLSILDLVPKSEATGNSVPLITESGSFDTAVETTEGAAKAVGDIVGTDSEVPVRTIAHYVKAYRQILSDVPELEAIGRTRLIYGVLRRVESQLLAGNGTGQNILGIMNTSGIGSVAFAGGTPLADLALSGLVTELLSEAQPTPGRDGPAHAPEPPDAQGIGLRRVPELGRGWPADARPGRV